MSNHGPDRWERICQAHEALSEQLEGDPDVYYVDIGYAQGDKDGEPSLRVHIYGDGEDETYPKEVNGVTIVITCDRNHD